MFHIKTRPRSNSPIQINSSVTTSASSPVASLNVTDQLSAPPQSSASPVSPNPASGAKIAQQQKINFPKMTKVYSVKKELIKHGYKIIEKITRTLQGSIWKCVNNADNKEYIIKVTDKQLHNKRVAYVKGNYVRVKENIVKEASVLRYLTLNNPPNSLAKYHDFFQDKYNYFLVTEYGGTDLFEFVIRAHGLIGKGNLSISEWQRFIKGAMRQIVEVMDWLHNKMQTAHLDISLENFVISNVMVQFGANGQMTFMDGFQIKLIDFGVAEVFPKNKNGKINFLSKKYVGKTLYKAPKVFAKKETFDAAKADCWSLGIVLFSMITGSAPFLKPKMSDKKFESVIGGNLFGLLNKYDKLSYLTANMFDVMNNMLKPEKYRVDTSVIKNHKWLS